MTRKRRLLGNETLVAPGLDLKNASVLDFWQWAYSDLIFNDVRGTFAEWLVAKLLDIALTPRVSWQPWDLTKTVSDAAGHEHEIHIEVKTSAWCQEWRDDCSPQIVFSGLKGRLWDPQKGNADGPTYNADLFVFCLEEERNKSEYNALILDQWRFSILEKEDLQQLNCASIGKNTVASKCEFMTAADFRVKATQMLNSCAKR